MTRTAKIVVPAVTVALVIGLVALAAPAVLPLLPRDAQAALGGTIDTVPGTVDELLAVADLAGDGRYGDRRVTHEHVDGEYVEAATIWPWTLPPGWAFPQHRGVADTPGAHWNGMGVNAAFSLWATASLRAVRQGEVDGADGVRMLDEIESAYRILFAEGVLTDRTFIETAVSPLRAAS